MGDAYLSGRGREAVIYCGIVSGFRLCGGIVTGQCTLCSSDCRGDCKQEKDEGC